MECDGVKLSQPDGASEKQRVALRVDDGVSEEVYWFHTDDPSLSLRTGLGSTGRLSDSAGEPVPGSQVRLRSVPYGEYRTTPTANLTDVGFTGHRQQDELGLLYARARFYVPSIGRFLSADSIAPNPADPQQLNRYSYARNNALRYTDPTGHYIFEEYPFPTLRYSGDQEVIRSPSGDYFVPPGQTGATYFHPPSAAGAEAMVSHDDRSPTVPSDEISVRLADPETETQGAMCPAATAAGVLGLVTLIPVDALYVAAQVALAGMGPEGVVADALLVPVDLALMEVHFILIQVVEQSVRKPCGEIHVDAVPPFGMEE